MMMMMMMMMMSWKVTGLCRSVLTDRRFVTQSSGTLIFKGKVVK